MATSKKKASRVDVKTLYPNFYAEQRQHHVQESSTMTVTRKHRDSSAGTRRDGSGGTSSRPNGFLQLKQRIKHYQSKNDLSTRQTEHSRRVIPPIITVDQSSNQHEGLSAIDNDNTLTVVAPSLRPSSRHVALRGELSLNSPAWDHDNTVGVSPRLQPLLFPTALNGSTNSASTARLATSIDGESLQNFVINTRPRTRYARREFHRQGSAPALARISTAPMTLHGRQSLDAREPPLLVSCRSMGTLHTAENSHQSRQAVQSAVIQTIETVLPQTEVDDDTDDDDDTNFFLTELEATARVASSLSTAKLHILARHLALASFLLYGNPPALVAAVQHVTAALKSLNSFQNDTDSINNASPAHLALKSLLHHHQGVALRELVVASTSPTSKVAIICTKHAFAAQRRALELAQRAQDPRLQARAVKALGLLLLDAHAYQPALTHQQEALQIALKEKDRELEARVYANLGNLALAQLDFGHALSCHHRDLHLCSSKALDSRLGRARAHRNLANIHAKLHRRDQQLHHEKEARIAEFNDGGAYLNDIRNHADSSVGNICLQSTTSIEPALVNLVAQNLSEIVRGLSTQRHYSLPKEIVNNDSITAVLEQEWTTAQVDLEAAIDIVSTRADTPLTISTEPVLTYQRPTKLAISHHVSIRIDNYSSGAIPMHIESSVESQEYTHK